MSNRDWFSAFESDSNCTCDVLDKKVSSMHYVSTMLNRTIQMFEYKGLPDTIPQDRLELMLQMFGHVAITEVNGKLYALRGGLGGAPDPYYRQTLYVVANPALGISKSMRILNHLDPFNKQDSQGECVLMKNDTLYQGMMYMYSRYASELTENDISIRCAQINSRQQSFIAAGTDAEVAAAQLYLDSLEAGKIIAVGQKAFLDGISANNMSIQSANVIIQLIELQQYLKASWFNEIGLNANFNMKREYMSEEEIAVSTDLLLPLIDDMLQCRKDALELVNSTYGVNITVEKNSAWEDKQMEIELSQRAAESEASTVEVNSNEQYDSP